jgi:hypothetical protein
MSQDEGWRIVGWDWEKRAQIRVALSELRAWFPGTKQVTKEEKPGILILQADGSGEVFSRRYQLLRIWD